jgi:hypothetical protein
MLNSLDATTPSVNNGHAKPQPALKRTATGHADRNGTAPTGKLIDPLEAQHGVLCHILLEGDGDKIRDARRNLETEHFQQPQCRTIAEVLWKQFDDAAPLDAKSIGAAIEARDFETYTYFILNVAAKPKRLPDFRDSVHTVHNWKRAAQLAKPRFPRIGLSEIFARPRLEYLIQDILLERGTGVLSGDYGAYKSFQALSMGLCVATGMDWHGRKTKRGTVVYIIAEGAYTTADRARAFLIRHQIEPPKNFHIIETPAQIANAGECATLIAEIAEIEPALIIIDTLAKCNLGSDENDTGAMGLFTAGMERIAGELDSFVLAIHHNNKNGSLRGSSALPSNVDTHIVIKPHAQHLVTIECDKQKGAAFEKFSLIGRVVELPEIDEYGRTVTSLVFDATDTPEAAPTKTDYNIERVYQALAAHPDGLRASEWQKSSGLSSSRFYDLRQILLDTERVNQDDLIYKVTPITPITPIRSESERENHSDYSDDALASEQSEYSDTESHKTKSEYPDSETHKTKTARKKVRV